MTIVLSIYTLSTATCSPGDCWVQKVINSE